MVKYEGPLRTNKVKNGKLGKLVDDNTKPAKEYVDTGWRYPTQLLHFQRDCLTSNLHPTQKQKINPDGTTTVTFEAGGRYEICWHLFRWGKDVKILEPQELKDTYKELLDKAIKQI